jgi:Protein kinase domain
MPELRESVGRYEILDELGSGGMSTVYLARQVDLDRLVALKELGALRSSDPSFARRFLREAQLAGSLSDPNIVTVYDYFDHGGAPYIAMEYLEYGSLRPHIEHMTLSQIGGVLQAVLAGLAVAETRQIVHRDLKPENLLVAANGRIKISDFGIAKATNEVGLGTALTSTGVAVGTPNYMAPEQATAQAVGPWTDLYSVGVMAFEFFVGHPPFADTDNALGVLLRQVNEEIPPVRELDAGVDARLSDWIERMVAKEPSQRPESAGAAWDELEDTLIALLGARWQREAGLAPFPQANDRVLPGRAPLLTPPTQPRGRQPLATTMPPRVLPEALPEVLPEVARRPRRKRRVGAKTARLIVAGVAVVAAAAALLGRSGGSSAPRLASAPDPATTTASRTTSPARPTNPSPGAVTLLGRQQSPSGGAGSNARTLTKEATSARGLAKQYDSAAAKIERLSGARVAGSPTARLAAAMRGTAADYRIAAAAAGAGDRAGYEAAMTQVSADKKAVNTALADLRASARAPAGGTNPTGGSPSTGGSQQSPPVARTPCSGDSVSDDPSDESC